MVVPEQDGAKGLSFTKKPRGPKKPKKPREPKKGRFLGLLGSLGCFGSLAETATVITIMPSIIGIDLGGTKIAAARYDADTCELQQQEKTKTPSGESFEPVFDSLASIIDRLRTDDTAAIGIGIPGLVRHPEGIIVTLPNIEGAENFPLKDRLESKINLTISVGNDANCFTLAEALFGAGEGEGVVIGITMGTGVGGGIVIDGKILRGSNGFAAEIGHMLLKPGKPPFEKNEDSEQSPISTNKRGDVEQFISGTAMGLRCKAAKRPEDYLKGEVCSSLQPEIFREVAWMCASLTHLLDPSVIVFGGSTGRALKPHLSKIKDELKQWLLPGIPTPELKIAELKDAATRGAALLTQQ